MFGLARKHTISPLVEAALGSKFDRAALTLINGTGNQVTVASGSTLMVEGTTGTEALLILDGTAAVSRGELVIANLGAGDLVGEQSLLTGAPRNATVIATSEVTALYMTRQDFNWLRMFSLDFGTLAEELAEERS